MLNRYCILGLLLGLISSAAISKEPLCTPPQLLGSVELSAEPARWTFSGNTVYLLTLSSAGSDHQLIIIDITDPAAPTILGSTSVPGIINWLTPPIIQGSALYALDTNQLHIFDISTPSNPSLAGQYAYQIDPQINVAVAHANHLYLGSTSNTTEILDLSSPLAPTFAAQGTNPFPLLAVINGTGYTTQGQAVDLTNPLNPIALNTAPSNNTHIDFHTNQSVVYLTGGQTTTLDLSDPLNPVQLGVQPYTELSYFEKITFRGSFMLRPYTYMGFFTLTDYSSPSNPLHVGYSDFEIGQGPFIMMHDASDVTYLATPSSFKTYQISLRPFVSATSTITEANDLVLNGDLAAIATQGGHLQLFNIEDPTSPTLISTLPLLSDALGIDTKDNAIYVANFRERLSVIDITDPANPFLSQTIDTGRRAMDTKVVGDLLYVVDRFAGLSIFDIQTPLAPQLLSVTNTPGWAREITIDQENQIAYIAHNKFDLQIYDVSDPTAPISIGSIAPINNNPDGTQGSGIETTTIDENLLYTAESADGYRIYDVTTPATPILLTQILPNPEILNRGYTHQITINGDQMFIANGTGGFIVYDNSDPMAPTETRWFQTREFSNAAASARRVQMRNNLAYTTVYEGGFKVYDLTSCSPCSADLNNDGLLNSLDISTFITLFSSSNPTADFTGDGLLNFPDVSAFVAAFTTGCP